MVENKKIAVFFLGVLLLIASLGFIIASDEDNGDGGCYPYDLNRLSYSTRDTGEVILLDGYNEFNSENVKFTHGNIYEGRDEGNYKGEGSIYGSATTKDGKEMKLNVRTSVSEIIENTCDRITWRNTGKGTYWVYKEGTEQVEYDYIDITYYPKTGKINVIGAGDVDFEFEDMADNRFEAGSIPLVPEFGLIVGTLTILSALGIFFFVRR